LTSTPSSKFEEYLLTKLFLGYGFLKPIWTSKGGLLKVECCFSWLANGLGKGFQV
jgi:hypothetical protein